jgi:uncharacterized membrane protein YgcG
MRSEICDYLNFVSEDNTAFNACDLIDFSDRMDSTETGDSSSWGSDLFDSGSSSDYSSDSGSSSDYGGDSGGGSDYGGGSSD